MNRSWEDETYPTEVGMKSKIEELERELQDAKELLQEFYDDSPVQNRDFDIWERTEKLLGMESEAETGRRKEGRSIMSKLYKVRYQDHRDSSYDLIVAESINQVSDWCSDKRRCSGPIESIEVLNHLILDEQSGKLTSHEDIFVDLNTHYNPDKQNKILIEYMSTVMAEEGTSFVNSSLLNAVYYDELVKIEKEILKKDPDWE
jgi:hypothetical protein